MAKVYFLAFASFFIFMGCTGSEKEQKEKEQVVASPGTTTGDPIVETTPATSAIALAGGGIHMCAILNTHQAKCWGYNNQGQLNIHAATNANGKSLDVSKAQFSQISAGSDHTCGLVKDSIKGVIPVCFGKNGSWLKVPEEKLKQVAAGADFTCFIKENDTVGCVGNDKLRIFSSTGPSEEIKAEDLPKYGIEIETGTEKIDYTNKKFKNIKAEINRVCGIAEDDLVYCMGDNSHKAGKSIAQKAIDYGIRVFYLAVISEDKKLHMVGPRGPINAMTNLAKPGDLKFKKVFSSISGVDGYLTDAGNTYDDGTPFSENTLLIDGQQVSLINQVSEFASNRGGPAKEDFGAYCALKTSGKVSCSAIKQGGVNNPSSLMVTDIPKEIAE